MSQLDLFTEPTAEALTSPGAWPDWWLAIEARREAGGRPLMELVTPIIEATKSVEVEIVETRVPPGVRAEIRLMEFRGVWAWGHAAVFEGHGLSQSHPQPWRSRPNVALDRLSAVLLAVGAIDKALALWRTTGAIR